MGYWLKLLINLPHSTAIAFLKGLLDRIGNLIGVNMPKVLKAYRRVVTRRFGRRLALDIFDSG